MRTTYSTEPIRVKQIDTETGEVIEIYPSIISAARDNFIAAKTVRRALKGNGYVPTKQLKFELA